MSASESSSAGSDEIAFSFQLALGPSTTPRQQCPKTKPLFEWEEETPPYRPQLDVSSAPAEELFEQFEATSQFCEEFLRANPSQLQETFRSFVLDDCTSSPSPIGSATCRLPVEPKLKPMNSSPLVTRNQVAKHCGDNSNQLKKRIKKEQKDKPAVKGKKTSTRKKKQTKRKESPQVLETGAQTKKRKRDYWHHCQIGDCDSPESTVMICCDDCNSWIHATCEGLMPLEASQMLTFVCRMCKKQTEKKEKRKENRKAKKRKLSKKEKRRTKEKKAEEKEEQKKGQGKTKEEEEKQSNKEEAGEGIPLVKQQGESQEGSQLTKICFSCRAKGVAMSVYFHPSQARLCRNCKAKLPARKTQWQLLQQEALQASASVAPSTGSPCSGPTTNDIPAPVDSSSLVPVQRIALLPLTSFS